MKALLVFILLTGMSLSLSCSALAETFPCPLSSRFPGFTLSENPKCRASISNGEIRICLSEGLWHQWLILKSPPEICGDLTGDWRLSSPLAIEPISKPKILFSSFRIHFLPSSSSRGISSLWLGIQRTREDLSQKLKPFDPWGIYRAMTLGEQNSNSPQSFLRSIGFFHLLNASGVHLYALAIFIGFISKHLLMSAQLPATYAIRTSRIITFLSWIWAWLLCGCRPGMLRPAFVGCAKLSSQSLGFKWRYWAPFALSFGLEFICAIIHDKAFFNEGRVEVALAVGGFLMAVQGERSHWLALMGGWIFVAIVQAYHCHSISLLAPALGFLSLPLFCSLSYPLILSGLAFIHPLGAAMLQAPFWVLHILVAYTLKLPSLWVISRPSLSLGLAFGLLWMALSISLRRLVRVLILLPLFLAALATRLSPGRYESFESSAREVVQLDVGQGDSALVLSADTNHAGLIDAGSAHTLNDPQWIQTLSQEGITRLDWIGLTHLDEDHAGGVERLSRLVPIGCIASSRQEVWSERGQKMAQRLMTRGIRLESWDTGCVPFPIYRPRDLPTQKHHKANGNLQMSAVLVPLHSGDFYLSAGDAEGDDEISIMKWANQNAPAPGQRILKISHHGSNTSSDPKALKLFHPDSAVISVGLGNRYGHPTAEVLSRLSEMKIPVHRTDLEGPFRAGDVLHRPPEHRP